jgi:hypothetical protein
MKSRADEITRGLAQFFDVTRGAAFFINGLDAAHNLCCNAQ